MSLPWTNATLSRVAAAGAGDSYDSDSSAGADRWTGSVGVTLRERHIEQIAGGRIDQVDDTHLILPYDVGARVQRGDLLTFTFEGTPRTRKAGTIVRAEKTGRVRVDLEDT